MLKESGCGNFAGNASQPGARTPGGIAGAIRAGGAVRHSVNVLTRSFSAESAAESGAKDNESAINRGDAKRRAGDGRRDEGMEELYRR